MVRPVPGGGCSRPCRPCRRGAAARGSSTPRQTGRRHRSPTAGAAPGSPHPPDVVAALGAVEGFAESAPGPATPRRWRLGRKAQAGSRRSRSFPPAGHRVAPPPLAREVPPPPTLLSPRATNCAGRPRTAATPLLRRDRGRTPVATRAATAANAPESGTRTRANPPANAPPRPHQSHAPTNRRTGPSMSPHLHHLGIARTT